jgi:dynein heavy chain
VTVISTIKGYGDYFWVDVVEKVDEWGEQVLQYQAQCKKLPKALRDWQAYVDCRCDIQDALKAANTPCLADSLLHQLGDIAVPAA